MTKVNQKIWAVLLAALMVVSVVAGFSFSMNATKASAATAHVESTLDVQKAKDGNWYTFNTKTKKINKSYTGVAKNKYGWWRVYKGKVDFNATGVYSNSYGLWYVEKGKANFDFNGTVTSNKKKYVVRNGKATPYEEYTFKQYDCNDLVVRRAADNNWYAFDGNDIAYDYTGIAPNNSGWWRIVDGRVDWDANGIYSNNNGSFLVKNGKVDFTYSGIYKSGNKTYTVVAGEVKNSAEATYNTKYDSKKLQVKKGPDGNWYAYNGNKIAYDYTGIAPNENGWWRIEGGRVNFTAKGVYSNEYGVYYVESGKVNFGFEGVVRDAFDTAYYIVSGKAI